jgi:hypothetical protein
MLKIENARRTPAIKAIPLISRSKHVLNPLINLIGKSPPRLGSPSKIKTAIASLPGCYLFPEEHQIERSLLAQVMS